MFARISASLLFLVVLVTPIKFAARYVAGATGENPSLPSAILYSALLALLYCFLVSALWASRRLLVAVDRWNETGLAFLDLGIYGKWPFQWLLWIGAVLFAGSILAEQGDRLLLMVEGVAGFAAAFIGIFAAPPAPQPVDPYDPLPQPPAPIPQPAPPTPEPSPGPVPIPSEDVISLAMSWYFRKEPGCSGVPATSCQIVIDASRSRYVELQARSHKVSAPADYGRFVRDGHTPEVEDTARAMRCISEQHRLGTIGEINNVLAFAQRFKYASDLEDKGVPEYPKFPLETLVEDRGDCEDHAILAAACLVRLGYDVRLVSLERHMALAVAGAEEIPDAFALRDPVSGHRFYYCEATTDAGSRNPNGNSFRMGEIPEKDRSANMELILVK
jgi:predicted transglutaminase-like cysteine proteinase